MSPASAPPRDTRWRAALAPGNILAAGAIVAPPLAVFAPLGMAPLLALVAVALLAGDWRRCLAWIRPFAPLGALLVLLSLWAALTSLWSPIAAHSLFESARFLAICAAGLCILGAGAALAASASARLGRAAVIGVTIAVVLLQFELWSGKVLWHLLRGMALDEYVALARYDRGVTLLLLAAWPAAAALIVRRARWALAVLAIAVGITLYQFDSRSAFLAALIGLAALAAAWRLPRLVAVALVGGVALIAVAFPLVAPGGPGIERVHEAAPMLRQSAIHRLVIWRFVSDRIAERPLLGWGMDASRALPGGQEPAGDIAPELDMDIAAEALPLHPHDAALQWRVELGAPGALLCIAALGVVLWRIAADRSMATPHRALALGCAGAALTIAMLSFGAWQAWWLSSLWLTAALLAGARRREDSAAA
ncbi:MAG TPA: O-antigen ligase family protein [Stellaceae bacterium]